MPIPNPAVSNELSFTEAFVEEISNRIDQPLEVDLRASDIQAPVILHDYSLSGRTITFPVSMFGDGDAWNFDFEFFNPESPQTVYGSVPVAIAAGYGYDYLAVDPDGDTLRYEHPSHASRYQNRRCHAAFDVDPDSSGSHDFHLIATDPLGRTRTIKSGPSASNRQRLPTVHRYYKPLDDRSHPAMRRLQLLLQATDPENDTLTYQLIPNARQVMPPVGLNLNATTGLLEWTPHCNVTWVFTKLP